MSKFQKIRTFYKLSNRRKILLPITVFLSLYSIVIFRFFRKSATFGKRDVLAVKQEVDVVLIKDISFAIKMANKYVPWKAVCRHEAYQAKILCKYFNIPYQIFVGFRKNENGHIDGHAWTVVNDTIITGFCNPQEYVVQYFFS